jgi:hypothetical protein
MNTKERQLWRDVVLVKYPLWEIEKTCEIERRARHEARRAYFRKLIKEQNEATKDPSNDRGRTELLA